LPANDDLPQSAAMRAPSPQTWSAAFSDYTGRDQFGSLDGLRCLCILAVLWHHAPVWGGLSAPPLLLSRGFLGVDVFFVLSGFLITTLLLRETARRGHFSLRDFYRRRILRIVPVYFFVVTMVSAYYIWAKGQGHYAGLVPYYYLFLANFLTTDIPLLAPTWSLSVEEQYYLVWPLLIVINVAGIMGIFATLGVHALDLGPLHIALPNATYAPILMGSALALLLNNARGFSALFHIFGWRGAPLVLMLILVGLAAVLPADLRGLPNLAIHLVMTACLASLVLREDHSLAPVLTWRPMARVGMISYGIYLYHLIGLRVATSVALRLGMTSPWLLLLIYSIISILIAEISYRSLR